MVRAAHRTQKSRKGFHFPDRAFKEPEAPKTATLVNMLRLPRGARGSLSAQCPISTMAPAFRALPLQKGNVSWADSHWGTLKRSQPADVPGYLFQTKTASLKMTASTSSP